MTEIHVFDFDGTLFRSPTPHKPYITEIEHHRLRQAETHDLYGKLMSAPADGGLGWFQSLVTLSPPTVPAVAAAVPGGAPPAKEWYVMPAVERLRRLGAERSQRDLFIYILTGRDVKYHARIAELLDQQGLTPYITEIFCKAHETAGTVKYKCATLGPELLWRRHPRASRLYYYEDRPEQGGRLADGLNEWLRRCYFQHERPPVGATAASSSSSSSSGDVLLKVLPLDAAAPIPPAAEAADLTLLELFGQDIKTLERTRRQSARWVDTVVASDSYAALCLREAPRPPQALQVVMVFVPPALVAASEQMLDLEETEAVVAALLQEKKERGQGHANHTYNHHNFHHRGGSGGRGRARGRGGRRWSRGGGGGRGGNVESY